MRLKIELLVMQDACDAGEQQAARLCLCSFSSILPLALSVRFQAEECRIKENSHGLSSLHILRL